MYNKRQWEDFMIRKPFSVDSKQISNTKFIDSNPFYVSNELLSSKFDEYNIPKEFQKLFFYKKSEKYLIKEFFTDLTFVILEENDKVDAILKIKYNGGANFYSVNGSKTNCSKNDILNFYTNLYRSGFLNSYLKAIHQYFLLNTNLKHDYQEDQQLKKDVL